MRLRALSMAALCGLAVPTFAADLWNQMTDGSLYASEVPDQVATDVPTDSTWMVSDVIVGGAGWNVNSVETVFNALSAPDPYVDLHQAMLNVFPNSGSGLPLTSQDPSAGQMVFVNISHNAFFGNEYNMIAPNLNLHLSPGEYWIGLTPVGSEAVYFNMRTVFTRMNTAGAQFSSVVRNPLGGQGQGTQWQTIDAWENHFFNAPLFEEMDIQGTPVPEPASLLCLVAGGVCLLRRRRR